MPRPQWTGSLSFGLVNVPVTLYSAVRDRGVHFNQLHEADGSPIATRRVCSKEDREVPWSEIAKGYELPDGRWVLLTDEDLQAASPRRTRTIDIERFVAEDEIDPVYYEHPYLIVPREDGAARAYALLGETMRTCTTVALGRLVMRAKEHLVAIRAHESGLTLNTMRFHDEVRATAPIAEELGASTKPSREQVEHAVAIIEELGVSFDPECYHDEHRKHLEKIIAQKLKGKKIKPPAPPKETPTTAPDLMGALEQSLAEIRARGGGAPKKRRSARSPTPQSPQRAERQRP